MGEGDVDPTPLFKVAAVFLSLVLLVVISLPFLGGELFRGHDILSHMLYVRGFYQALSEGQFPVRVIGKVFPGHDFYVFNYYQPMFYYFTSLAKFLGLSYTQSFLLTLWSAWIASGVFMFLFVRKHFTNFPALLSAFFYMIAPYHIVQIFVRVDVGEFLAAAFVPAVLWSLNRLWEKRSGLPLFLTAVIFAGFLLSHNILSVMFLPVFLLYIVYLFWRDRSWQPLLTVCLALAFGFGLAAYFLIPALEESGLTHLDGSLAGSGDFRNNFVCFNQLFSNSWGYDGSVPGCDDKMPFQLGFAHWLAVLGALIILLKSAVKKRDENLVLTGLFFLVFLIAIFMILPVSMFVWERIYWLYFFQFSWRFLILAAFASSILAGGWVYLVKNNKNRYLLGIGLMSLGLYLYSWNIHPPYFIPEDQINFNNENFLLGREEDIKSFFVYVDYFDSKWVNKMPENFASIPASEAEVKTGKAEVEVLAFTQTDKKYLVKAEDEATLRFYTHYFPDWQVTIDGKSAPFSVEEDFGYIILKVPQGEHSVELSFHDTAIRAEANKISIVSAMLLVIVSLVYGKIRPRKWLLKIIK